MAFFIKCVNPNYLVDALYALKDGKPHRLVDPKSNDRDWFPTAHAAGEAKKKAVKLFGSVAPSTKFRVERK